MKLSDSQKRALKVMHQQKGLKRVATQRIYFALVDSKLVYFQHATVQALIRAGLATETRRPTSRLYVVQRTEVLS